MMGAEVPEVAVLRRLGSGEPLVGASGDCGSSGGTCGESMGSESPWGALGEM